VAVRRRISYLLILLIFLSVFLGSHYHFCEYHSQSCSICALNDSMLFLPPVATTNDIEPPHFISQLLVSAGSVPVVITSAAPLRGRAPPAIL